MKVQDAHITTTIQEPIWHFLKYAKCVAWMWNNVGRHELILNGDDLHVKFPQPPPEGIMVTVTYEFEY